MTFRRPVWFIPIFLAFILCLNFFWSKPLVPGFDTPFYLSEIRDFSNRFPNPVIYSHLDRYLTIAFPASLSRLFNFDPVTSYRITITLIYLLITTLLYHLLNILTKNQIAASLMTSSLVISPFMITYSTMLLANFTGFLILFAFFTLVIGKNFRYKNVLLGTILGLVFYTHNFSTVLHGLIIAFYYLLKLIFTKQSNIIKNFIIVFVIAGVVGFLGLSRYLGLDLTFSQSQNIRIVVPTFTFTLGDEKRLIINSFREHTGKFWLGYFLIIYPTFIYMERNNLKKHASQFLIPLAIFIPSFILTFQPLYKISFLPERFASMVGLSMYFLYFSVVTMPVLKKYIIPLSIMPLFLNYLTSDSLILNKGYRSFSEREIRVYEDIKPLIKQNSVLLIASDHFYWSRYILDNQEIVPGEHFVSCGDVTKQGLLNDANYLFAKLLSETDNTIADGLLNTIRPLFPQKQVYILSNDSLKCGHGKVLHHLDQVKNIYNNDSWSLYEI